MNLQYDNILVSSFKEWMQHRLLNDAQAYKNVSGSLYFTQDREFRNNQVFTAPFHQWVYDSSVSGANIPSGIYVNNTFIARGTSGLAINYDYGKAILPSSTFNNNASVTASYAYKDFNIYVTTKSDKQLLIESKFLERPILKTATTGINTYSIVAPCIFIRNQMTSNSPFSFGGTDLTTNKIIATVFSRNEGYSYAINSFFRDSNNLNFSILSNTPLNYYRDLKSGNYWNYTDQIDNNNIATVEDVDSFLIDNDKISEHQPGVFVSSIEFTIKKPRIFRN